jgi:hypothetical protein
MTRACPRLARPSHFFRAQLKSCRFVYRPEAYANGMAEMSSVQRLQPSLYKCFGAPKVIESPKTERERVAPRGGAIADSAFIAMPRSVFLIFLGPGLRLVSESDKTSDGTAGGVMYRLVPVNPRQPRKWNRRIRSS